MEVLYVTGYDMPTVKARMQAKLQQDPSIDYVVTLGAPFAPVVLDAIGAAGSSAKVGTFDMSPVAIDLIAKGKMQWAIDQQPYVEGYEAVDMLWLYVTNGDTVGGGEPVLTGPFFVTKDNADAVAKFAKMAPVEPRTDHEMNSTAGRSVCTPSGGVTREETVTTTSEMRRWRSREDNTRLRRSGSAP